MTAADQRTYEQRATTLQSRAFLDRLYERRDEVFEHAISLERGDSIAAFVFDLFVRLAQHNHSYIDRSLIQRLSDQLERFEEPISEVNIPLMEGMVLTLEQALTLGAPPPSTHEIVNALFARGYQIYLEAKTSKERQEFASKVIKLLPSIERLGPYRLSDFIDCACDKDEATRFWQLYVERVAAEVDRRIQPSERDQYTWTLSALLKVHELGPNALIGKRWEVLRRHVERIMQSRQEDRRWRYLRLIIESCRDHRTLYFILNSPAVIEDQAIPFIFLTRGNRKLQSCALFLLHTTKIDRRQIHKLLEYFEERTLAETGERAVELYAQTQLFTQPSQVIDTLAEGVASIIMHKLKDEPVEPLLNSVTNDAHAFRQSLFLVQVIPEDRIRNTPAHVQLLERVLQSFFHTFTPSGVRHPLNDQVFQRGVARAIAELMRDQDGGHTAHLKSFGFTLNKAAKRWRPGDSDEELAKQQLLLSYFVGLYVHVLRKAARHLYKKYETRPRATELYNVIIKLFLRERDACVSSGAYEAILPLMHTLFPELVSSDYLEEPAEARIEQAASLMGLVEEERTPEDNLSGLLSEWRDRNRGRDLVEIQDEEAKDNEEGEGQAGLEIETKGHIPIVTTVPVRAPVRLYEAGRSAGGSVLQTYLGIEVLRQLTRRLLNLFGVSTQGELSLSGEQILLEETHQQSGRGQLASRAIRFHVSQVSGVSVEQPLRAFYLVFGVIALVTFCFIGGHFLFAGVRGAETELGLLGLGFIVLGFVLDATMSALRESSAREVLLKLDRHNSSRPIVMGVDRIDPRGQALINAFVSEAVKQKEEQFMQSLAEAAERAASAKQTHDDESMSPSVQDEKDGETSQKINSLPSVEAQEEREDQAEDNLPEEDDDIGGEASVSDGLDISFEDEDSEVGIEEEVVSSEPLTQVPPLPGEATLEGLDQALSQVNPSLNTTSDEQVSSDFDNDVPKEKAESLSEAFEFVTAMGQVNDDQES